MGRNIYFSGSIQGGRQDEDLYYRLIEQLERYGKVLTEFVGQKDLDKSEASLTDKVKHDKDVKLLKSCDVVVAEVTQPSLGVGYEIGRAVDMKKRILCLFRPASGKRLSAMIGGAEDGDNFIVKHYEEPETEKIFKDFFSR